MNFLTQDWQSKPKEEGEEHYQFFPPSKPSGEKYLILNSDGQTPSDYHKLIDEQDQQDKRPSR